MWSNWCSNCWAAAGVAVGAVTGTFTIPGLGTFSFAISLGVVGAVAGAVTGAMAGGYAGYQFGRLIETKVLGWS